MRIRKHAHRSDLERTACARSAALAAILLMGAGVGLPAVGASETVVGFRNDGSGFFPDTTPPLAWTATRHVAWRWDAPLFGATGASPLVVGNRVFVLADPLTLVCLDRNAGTELWRHDRHALSDAAAREAQEAALHWFAQRRTTALLPDARGRCPVEGTMRTIERCRRAAPAEDGPYFQALHDRYRAFAEAGAGTVDKVPATTLDLTSSHRLTQSTPVSDGARLAVVFVHGLVVCYELDGSLRWATRVSVDCGRRGRIDAWTGLAVAGDRLLVACRSQIYGLDWDSGATVWETAVRGAGGHADLVLGTMHDGSCFLHGSGLVGRVEDGTKLFQAKLPEHNFPLTVAPDDRAFHFVQGAIALPQAAGESVRMLWKLSREQCRFGDPQVCRFSGHHAMIGPVVDEAHIFYLEGNGNGLFSCADAATGELLRGTPKKQIDSPGPVKGIRWMGWKGVGSHLAKAGDRLYLFPESGHGVIFDAQGAFPILAINPSLGPIDHTEPAFIGRQLLVRTRFGLFCINNDHKQGEP